MTITVGTRTMTATLFDNATARSLLAQLPLTSTLDDSHEGGKTVPLTKPLSLPGAAKGEDPLTSDLVYYAPDQALVMIYGDVGCQQGLVRVGHVDVPRITITTLHAGDKVTITRAP